MGRNRSQQGWWSCWELVGLLELVRLVGLVGLVGLEGLVELVRLVGCGAGVAVLHQTAVICLSSLTVAQMEVGDGTFMTFSF